MKKFTLSMVFLLASVLTLPGNSTRKDFGKDLLKGDFLTPITQKADPGDPKLMTKEVGG